MKIFTREEWRVVGVILLVIAVISFFNFQVALRRGRDNERENDLGDIAKMLDTYKSKNSIYPTSLSDLPNAPKDPGTPNGFSYLYITDGKFFQLYSSLEGGNEESQYLPSVAKLNLKCGKYVCNFGKSSGNIPLDKTIQEYENDINAKNKK